MTVPPVSASARRGPRALLVGAIVLSLIPAAALVLIAGQRVGSDDPSERPNTAPQARDDAVSVRAGEATPIHVTVNDPDGDGDPLVVTGVEYTSGNGATISYGENLVLNGDGVTGDTTNFTNFGLAAGAGPDGQAAFVTSEGGGLFSDELILVDTDHAYSMVAWSKASPNTGARHFAGFASYDVDGQLIQPWHVLYGEGSEAQLAADLAPGDTEISLTDATGWSVDPEDPGHFRNIVFYPWTSRDGQEHEPYTYSRHVLQAPPEGLWAPAPIEGNTIRLRVPWNRPNPDEPDGVWPAGTAVANSHSGATFSYALVNNSVYSSDWREHRAVVAGVGEGGESRPREFRPGTAFIRFAVAPNRNATGSTAFYAGIEVSDGSVVVYEPADGFSGTDTFSYTVEDGRGGAATATVTVEVAPNSPPQAVADRITLRAGASVGVDPLENDVDPEGDQLRITSIDYDSGNGANVFLNEELVENGDGSAGSNENFRDFVFVPGVGPDGQGAFATTESRGLGSDKRIPVDVTHAYALEVWSQADPNVGARHFVGFTSYDAEDQVIQPWHVNYGEGSETELAEDLAPGDTRIVLADASGWSDDPADPGHHRNIVMYPYVDGSGNTYEPYTYSRHVQPTDGGLWLPGSIDGATIELLSPWSRPNPDDPAGVWRAGTKVANSISGATFNYALVANSLYTSQWVRHTAVVSGVAEGGAAEPRSFRPGTAAVRLAVAPNRDANGSRAFYAGFSMRDLTATVTYQAGDGFAGTDGFTYEVADGRGGTAIGEVTVEVVANGVPAVADDTVEAVPGQAVGVDVLANDSDPDGDPLEVIGVTYDSGNGGNVIFNRDLVVNGSGTAGDNTNFSLFDYLPGAGPNGEGAFVTTETRGLFSDEFIPVDVSHAYDFSAWSKAEPNVGARHFMGFASYDADRRFIQAWHVRYGPGTETELAADLAPGDTEIVLADAAGWRDLPDDPGHFRNIVVYPYTDDQGTTYEPYTYSRHVSQVPDDGLWAPGSIAGNTITLRVPWSRPNPDDPAGVWPAGTPVANAHGGATFNYALASNALYTSEWLESRAELSGVASGGDMPVRQFRPGTAFIRVAIAANRDLPGSTAYYARFVLSDRDAPPLTFVPAAGFTGTDEFTYTVADGLGGTATATVTVTVGG